MYIVAAPSGAGKTSLTRTLVEDDPSLSISVSHTTRPARPEEQDGVHYYFVDEARFNAMAEAREFLEHARVFGAWYGTSRAEVLRHHESGHNVILEIDWQGARQVRAQLPGAIGIFILPPSVEALRHRLTGRGDGVATVERRMQPFRDDVRHYDEFDYVIVNQDFETALAQAGAVIRGEETGAAAGRPEVTRLVGELVA